MTATEYRDAAKKRLGVESVSTFDTVLADFVTQAVNRLAPKAMQETDKEVISVTVSTNGEAEVDLSALTEPVDDVRLVEAYDGVSYYPVLQKYRHASTLTVRGLSSDVTSLAIYGLDEYEVTQVPPRLELAVIWFTMADFYDYLAGNRSKYNIYAQSSGARAVDNMRDESIYFESKAEVYLDEHTSVYGS